MADIKWIKLSVDMFDDEKIKLVRSLPEGDAIMIVWIQLLTLAGKTNDSGMIYISRHMAYSEEMLATIFDHPLNVIRLALQTLERFELVEVNPEGVINITNWEKHQSTDKMVRMKEQSRIRQQKYYYRNKLRELGVNVDAKGFTDDLEELKNMVSEHEKPNVRLALANETEVRSKKLEVRSKNKDSSSAELTENFEKLWTLYPNKQGKKKAFISYQKAIRDGVTNKEIQDGIVKYKKHLANNDWLKPANGSTWFNNERWNDEYESVSSAGKPKLDTDWQKELKELED